MSSSSCNGHFSRIEPSTDVGDVADIQISSEQNQDEDEDAHAASLPENPLLNNIVIEEVLKCCDPIFLYTCRLVCKKWESEAWKQIQRRTTFTFDGFFDAGQKMSRVFAIPTLNTRRWLQLCKLEFAFFVADMSEPLLGLLMKTGQSVTELSLLFRDTQLSKLGLVGNILKHTPNLQRLALKSLPCELFSHQPGVVNYGSEIRLLKLKILEIGERCHYTASDSEVEGSNTSVRFFTWLLSTMPNLEQLNGKLGWSASSLVKSLEAISLPNLSHLLVIGGMTRQCAETLETLRLKTLYLGVSAHYNEDSRHNVIYAQRHYLQTLGVGWASFHSRISNTQLQEEFPQLRCLSLCDYSKWNYETCPKKYLLPGVGIQKLRVDIRVSQDFDFVQDNPSFKNVKDLDISFCVKFQPTVSEEDMILQLKSTFPQLQMLTMRVSEDYPFGLIFKYFEDIEKLSIIIVNQASRAPCSTRCVKSPKLANHTYLDSFLVGLNERRCKSLRRTEFPSEENIESYLQVARTHLSAAKGKASRMMPLSNMQNLKKLIIVTDRLLVSSVTVELCLWILPNLVSITIDKAERNVEAYLKKVLSPAVHLRVVPLPGPNPLTPRVEAGSETKYNLD